MKKSEKKVLTYSANRELVEAMAIILSGHHFSHTEETSFDKIITSNYDFIIIDYNYSKKTKIESFIRHAEIPVLAIISSVDHKARREVINWGVFDYIEYPFDLDRIEMILKKIDLVYQNKNKTSSRSN